MEVSYLRRDKDHEQIIESQHPIILNISEVSYINLCENPSEKKMRKNYEYSFVLKNNFGFFKTTRIFVLNVFRI